MKRLFFLVLMIGLSMSSVSTAKGHDQVIVSFNDQGFHYDAVTTIHVAEYIPSETKEVIIQYAECVPVLLEANKTEIFHPPSLNDTHLANYEKPNLDNRRFRRDYANGVRLDNNIIS